MNLRLKLLKILKVVPNVACRLYCRKHLQYLSYDALVKKCCLEKRGLLKKPCEYLTWFPIHPIWCWPPVELRILETMGWKMPESTFEEQLRDLRFKGEMQNESG